MTAILEIEKLSKSFGGLCAIHTLDFTVPNGAILGIIGPNGAGKTTVFNLITGALKPDAGRIRFKSRDITGAVDHEVCRYGIARTFQLVKPFANLTSLDNVIVGRLYGKEPAKNIKEARADSEELLNFVGLFDKRDKIAQSLTIAERKKLELARALAAKPQLLLLDEIMAGLNPVETQAAMGLVKKINDSGITVLLVEHVMHAVLGISTALIVISNGKKIAEGSAKEITDNAQVREAYLGKGRNA